MEVVYLSSRSWSSGEWCYALWYQHFRWTCGFHLRPKDEGGRFWNVDSIYHTTESHPSNM